jgi:imidazolonepropionase-like amidohydrolase
VGIAEESIGWAGDDVNEMTDPATPHLRAIDAINPQDQSFQDALSGGVTTVMVAPGSANVIGGLVVVMKTHGRVIDEMIVREPAGLKAALGENPKRVYSRKDKFPSTRMASAAVLRDNFVKAQNYIAREAQARSEGKPFERDLRMEAVAKVLRREIPLRLHAHRADDILTAIRIRDEFDFDITIEHATDGIRIADVLAKRGIPAMVGPNLTTRTKYELKDRTLETPAILTKAGVKVAIITDHYVIPIQHLIVSVMLAVKGGLSPEDALNCVTINPAEIMGIDGRVGSLDVGKDADIQILSGDPLDVRTNVEMVYVNGELAYKLNVGD